MKYIIILAILASACESKQDHFGNPRIQDDAIYLRDSLGRCLRIEIKIHTVGSQLAQEGKIDTFLVNSNQPCYKQSESIK